MKVRFIPPPESDATVELQENGELHIFPRFPTARSSASIGSVVVKVSEGKERRFSLCVHGGQGRVVAYEAKSVEAEFDKT